MTAIPPDQCLEAAQKLVSLSSADDAIAHVGMGESGFTRFSNNIITQSGARASRSVSASAAFGTKHGGASSNQMDGDSLSSVVSRAEEAANASEPDPEYLPPVEPPQQYLDVPAHYDGTTAFGPTERAEAVGEVLDVAKSAGLTAAGSIANSFSWCALANSRGLSDVSGSTSARMVVTMMGDGFSGWTDWQFNDVSALDARAVAEQARDYALGAEDPVDLEPGRYTVLLLPSAVMSILSPMVWRLDARAADEGRSALVGLEGKVIADESFTLRSDPTCPDAPGARRYGDGTAAGPMAYIENGVLNTLTYSRFWAKEKDCEPVYSPANILINGTSRSVEDLIAEIDRGLLITRFWYIRDVDPMRLLLTGMTRDSMLLIEGGKVTAGVKHFRWNNSPLDLLKNIRAIGKPQRQSGSLVPPIVFDDFYMTSKTQF